LTRAVGSTEARSSGGAGFAGAGATTVWISPSATSFACLCESCLEAARLGGELFGDALAAASVRGSIALETAVASVRCPAGHQLVLRRVERPPGLSHPDDRQLQIA
jgi:hypothetical protein